MTLSLASLSRLISLHDTKANIEALTGTPTEIVVALASDTEEIGVYAGGTWHWFGAASFDATAPTAEAFGDTAAHGSTGFAADAAHRHPMPTAAVTTSGLTQATGKLLGRSTASTGAIEEITVGTNLTLSAGTLSSSGGASSTDAAIWRPVLDGATGSVLQDGGTGEAIMAFGPA